MPPCPECHTEIDVDEFDVDRDDTLSCPECGANLTVTAVSPVELDVASDDDEDVAEAGADDDDDDTDDDAGPWDG